MPDITIQLTEDQWKRLQTEADRRDLAPEEVARRAVEEAIGNPPPEFDDLVTYILHKNRDLYGRLS